MSEERIDAARTALRGELQAILDKQHQLDRQYKKLTRALAALGDDAPPKRVQVGRDVVKSAAEELIQDWPEGEELNAQQAGKLKNVHPRSMGVYLRKAERAGRLVTRKKGRTLFYRPNDNGSGNGLKFKPGQPEPVDATA